MMKKTLFFCILAVLALAACQKVDEVAAPSGKTTFTMGIDQAATKTDLTGTVDIVWSKGDQISISTDTGMKTFTLDGDGGTATGDFSIDEIVSVVESATSFYPATLSPEWTDGWYVTIPDTYVWSEDGIKAPMFAWLDSSWNYFKLLTSVLKVEVYNMPATACKLVFTTKDQKVSGRFLFNAVPLTTEADAVNNTITVNFAPGEASKTFFIPVPGGTFTEGSTISLLDGDGNVLKTKKAPELTVPAGSIAYLPAIDCEAAGSPTVLLNEDFDTAYWAFNQFYYGSTTLSKGQMLHITFSLDPTVDGTTVTYWQLQFNEYSSDQWHTMFTFSMKDGETEVWLLLSDEQIAELNASVALAVSGYGVTVHKIEFLPVYPETVLWKGNFVCTNNEYTASPDYLAAKGLVTGNLWANLKVGKIVTVHYSTVNEWGSVELKTNTSGWPTLFKFLTPASSNVCMFELTTEEQVAALKNGLILYGWGTTFTKVTIR